MTGRQTAHTATTTGTGHRVLVCGSRHFANTPLLERVLDALEPQPTLIIHGNARGADRMAGSWAIAHGLPVEVYPAQWDTYGRAAGSIRNKQMLDEGRPDRVVAFPVAGGRGTQNMMRQAEEAGIPVLTVWPRKPRAPR